MEQLVLDWEGPFNLIEPTPTKKHALIGLYAVELNSKIVYIGKADIGKAEYQGTIAEARAHNFYENRLKEKGMIWDRTRALVYIGTVPQDQNSSRIDDAENLLIFKIKSVCNKKRKKNYKGVQPFQVINDGNRPQELPKQIKYPDP